MTQGLNEEYLTTVFVFLTCLLSLATVMSILATESRNPSRSYLLIVYLLLCAFVLMWFGSGFLVMLSGRRVDTAVFFRPMQAILISLMTGSIVFVYRVRIILIARNASIDELKNKLRELEKKNGHS